MRSSILLLAFVWPLPAFAQTVVGSVLAAESGTPIAGALVVLTDEAGADRASTLSHQDGRYLLRAPVPGRYAIRVEQIGRRTLITPVFDIGGDATIERPLSMVVQALELAGIEVEAEGRCELPRELGAVTARLWEEARKALELAAWSDRVGAVEYRLLRFERRLDPNTLRVLEEQTVPGRSLTRRSPFVSIPAESLAAHGYIRRDSDGGYIYSAPDAEVLLSDWFLDTHCFRARLGQAPEPGLVGLAFEPLRRAHHSDIEGVLWLDQRTSELRLLQFRYDQLPWQVATDKVGGQIEFARMPEGPFIVQRWWIRMPRIAERGPGPMGVGPRLYIAELKEQGGEVTGARSFLGEKISDAPIRR